MDAKSFSAIQKVENINYTLAQMKRGVAMKANHPLNKVLTHCNTCNIRFVCDQFTKDARCYFEIEALKGVYQKNNAIASDDPKDTLTDLQVTINKLEQVINYHSAPSKADLKNLASLKMRLYQLKHHNPVTLNQQNIQVNNNQTTIDIKKIMGEMRKEDTPQKEKVVEGEVLEENPNQNQDNTPPQEEEWK